MTTIRLLEVKYLELRNKILLGYEDLGFEFLA